MSVPLTTPKQIRCTFCRAQAHSACQRPGPGRHRIAYLKGVHPSRQAEFDRILAANPQATTDPSTWPAEAAS